MLIPPRYAITQAFRTIHASAAHTGTERHWLQWGRKGVLSGRLDVKRLEEDIRSGPTSASLTCMTSVSRRRLGKPATTFNIGRLVADRFVTYDDKIGWGAEQQVLVLRREVIEARGDHLEERSSPSGIAISRHALERLYERERCDHCTIHKRILSDLAEADRTLAFAIAAGLFVKGEPYQRNACTVLPLGQGLLYVRNGGVATKAGTNPTSRYVVGAKGIYSKPVVGDRARCVDIGRLGGIPVEGHLLAIGMTYLSSDMLFLEQEAYAALFHQEALKHDLCALTSETGRSWLPHEKQSPGARIEVDERLRYLLSRIVQPKPPGPLCLSIGWTGSDDPRSCGGKRPLADCGDMQ